MYPKSSGISVIMLIIMISIVIPGCGPSAEEQAATSATATSAAANDFPTGEFYIPLIEDPRAPFVWLVDGVYFKFNDDGTFTVTDTVGVQRMFGTYRIDDNLYTETSTDMKSCQIIGPATYRWRFQDKYLTFRDVDDADECNVRKKLMDG